MASLLFLYLFPLLPENGALAIFGVAPGVTDVCISRVALSLVRGQAVGDCLVSCFTPLGSPS